jgi:hypothetical protein
VKKRNLKEMFLGLFMGARRRAGEKPPGDSFKASPASEEAISETGGRLSQKPPGPPSDWLAKRSGGPPAHWVERVRQAAPELMQDWKKDEVVTATPPQPPKRIRRNSTAQAAPRPSSPPAPLRLERPAPAQRPPLDSPRKPVMQTESRPDDRQRHGGRKQEPPLPTFTVNTRKRDAGDLEKNSKETPELCDADSTVRFGDHSTATRLQISKATAQPNASFRNNLCANAPPRELGFVEESLSQRRKGANASNVLLGAEQSIGEPDKDEGRRQVREDTPEQKNNGRKNINRHAEHSWDFQTGSERPEFPTPYAIEPANATRQQVIRYPEASRAEARRSPVRHEGAALDSGYGKVEEREEVVANPVGPATGQDRQTTRPDKSFAADRRLASRLLAPGAGDTGASKRLAPHFMTSDQPPISYDIPAGRWPALFESSDDDYFDDAMAAWRELSHRRRLAREQAGSLWSE